MTATPSPFFLGGDEVAPGTRGDIRLLCGEGYTGEPLWLPATVVHGRRAGPVLALTASIHGDELNGIAVIREVLSAISADEVAGTIVCLPMVNVLGVQFHSRYLPDRRDLNRYFPGSTDGSMASRLAHAVMTHVVAAADVCIDLHTATNFRTNEPQIRISLENARARELGLAFGCRHLIDASLRPGSLREAAARIGVPVLTFEGGQALRFEPHVIDAGVRGTLRVMAALGMVESAPPPTADIVVESDETHWIRADRGGILDVAVSLGDMVDVHQPLWTVSSPLGHERNQRLSPYAGSVIGLTTLPLVAPGDAVVHIAVPGRHQRSFIDEPTDEEDDTDVDEEVGS